MAITYQSIDGTAVSDSATTLYTCPAGTSSRARIDKLVIANYDGSNPVDVTVYKVPSGGSAGNSNTISEQSKTIAIGGAWTVSEAIGQILAEGDTLQATASAASRATATGAVMEVT